MDLKLAAKEALAIALDQTGVRRGLSWFERRTAGGRRVLVLGYHRVARDAMPRPGLILSCTVSAATFRMHMQWLAARFELVTMTRAVEILAGREEAKRDVAVVTFDDGYDGLLEHALPALRDVRAPATLYVSTAIVARRGRFPHDRLYALLASYERNPTVRWRSGEFARETLEAFRSGGILTAKGWLHDLIRDRPPEELERLCSELGEGSWNDAAPPEDCHALDWNSVKVLAAAGWDIGTHTAEHHVLTHATEEATLAELQATRAEVETQTHRPARHFAYCNGYYSDSLVRALKAAGYASAVTTEDRTNRVGGDPFRIGRRVVWEGTARTGGGRQSESLLACQLDGAWTALGLSASESGSQLQSPLEASVRRHA